jgi:sugar phosphate isomerase/epimerase
MTTRTGGFSIGFRRGWSDWQKNLKALTQWAAGAGFEAIDLGRATRDDVNVLRDAKLKLGTADLANWQVTATDPGKRREAIAQNVAYIREAAALGARVFFTIVAGDPSRSRADNYATAVEAFGPMAQAASDVGAAIAIEGWPGGSPHLANLCCTPETYRSLIKDVGGRGIGVNYDPSHLIRLQVDHIRFLKEFAPYVKHVHGKDTDLDTEALYEFGTQPATFAKGRGFGEWTWRYTIPGHGCARWTEILRTLKSTGFAGIVSVELEDEQFNTDEAGEKAGLTASLEFLRSV